MFGYLQTCCMPIGIPLLRSKSECYEPPACAANRGDFGHRYSRRRTFCTPFEASTRPCWLTWNANLARDNEIMEEPPRKYHVPPDAAEELHAQARRAQEILERLAAALAATDPNVPPDERDLVLPEHVQRAAEQMFGSHSTPALLPALDVFVSYAAADGRFARRFVERLRANQLSCFFAAESIQPASLWMESIWQAVRECKLMVFLATPAALQSRWCTMEVGAALAMKKQVVPVLHRVRPGELPDYLRPFQAVAVKTTEQRDELVRFLTSLCSE